MSSKKDKFLESAQKFIQKGQLDRAIKDYEQVVALDPNDIRHRQRLAELLVRANRKEEAISEYEAIGKYYADNAFYLKAIAVYKQVQKLDPANIKISYNLATLNEKQGLTGNALAEYSRVYSHYDKIGKNAEALEILESMMALDPDNLNTRLKFAESRYASGEKDKAYNDFIQIATALRQRGDSTAFNQVCDRVRYLFSTKTDFTLGVAIAQMKSGDASSAMPLLQEIVRKDQGNLNAWQLLVEALSAMGDREERKSILQKMVRLFPSESSPREGLIQCALDEGDAEGVLFLISTHGEALLGKNGGTLLEHAYQSVLEIVPGDRRALQGLRHLYEIRGEQAKLAELDVRLEQGEVGTGAESLEEEVPPAEGIAGPLDGDEEEPDKIVAEEEGHLPSAAEAAEVPAAMEDVTEPEPCATCGGQLPTEPEEVDEVSIELEFDEDGLVHLADFGQLPTGDEGADFGVTTDISEDGVAAHSGLVSLPADNDFVDLEAELVSEIEPAEDSSAADYDKYSLDGLFSAFKKELDQHLGEDDTETHYNLGIAFKEMGLYDDAIGEFQAAAIDPRRKVDCITLQGVCCRDKGDFARAEDILRGGTSLQGLAVDELSHLKYELALLYEVTGRHHDALRLYHEINGVNPDFRDVAEKIGGKTTEAEQEYEELDLVELEEGENE